jgi:AcrR family transcriptional regulator
MAEALRKRTRRSGAAPASSARKTSPPEPITGMRRDLLAVEVLDKAAALFASKGFASTSLKDVADAVGLSRSSIYYYYPNKDALLSELIQGVTLPVANIFRDVERQGSSPLAKIREVARRLVLWVADPHTHFRLMDRSEAELPASIAKVHTDAKRRILDEMVKLIDSAVLAGEVRPVDARVSSLAIIGMAMWTAWWVRPGHGPSLDEVANTIADNAAASLQRIEPAKAGVTVADLAREIRDNLTLIEKMAVGRTR